MEINNSILLKLSKEKNFENIFGKFAKDAAFLSPGLEMLWGGDLFKCLPLNEIITKLSSPAAQLNEASAYPVKTGSRTGMLQLLPINYKSQFLGYTAIFVEGEQFLPDNLRPLNEFKHDLNNLLTLILNLISITDKTESVSGGLFLAKELMTGISGKERIDSTSLSLSQSLTLICNTFADSFNNKIIFTHNIPSSLLPINLGISNLLRILTNLITNAAEELKEEGTITVEAYNSTEGGNPFVYIKVTDTGRGIAEDKLQNIFKEGFSTKNRGSGAGLFIVKNIVEKTGGSISAASTPGTGTIFTIKYPSAKNIIKQIAIVEDERMLNEVLSVQFQDDYIVHSFFDGESLLSDALLDMFDLAIIDKKLPGIDGIKCITELRKRKKPIKIILASGSDPGKECSANANLIDRCVKKPYNFEELSSAVEELLS